eukprot:scaffold3065_cov72-Skeletonema_menzelii.AAC.1
MGSTSTPQAAVVNDSDVQVDTPNSGSLEAVENKESWTIDSNSNSSATKEESASSPRKEQDDVNIDALTATLEVVSIAPKQPTSSLEQH